MAKNYAELTIDSIGIDPAYQRDFDERRAKVMSQDLDWARFGVPVVARRAEGKYFVVDAQHRIAAAKMAGHGSKQILCEVHDGMTKREEAELFLKLNGGRKAIRAFDRYKARLVAEEPVALEFTRIAEACGLRIVPGGNAKNSINAVQAVESAHRRNRNLETTLRILKEWGRGDVEALDGDFIKDVSNFLADYDEDVDVEAFKLRLAKLDPSFVMRRIRGAADSVGNRRVAANSVLRDIYNSRRSRADRLRPSAVELGFAN